MPLNLTVIVLSLIFSVIVMPIGVIVCKKLYNNIKNEEHREKGKIIQRIMKTYSIVPCIFYTTLITFSWIIYINNHFLNWIKPSLSWYAIFLLGCMCHVFRIYIGFNSLIVAISRYLFILYEAKVEAFGIKRLKNLLVSASMSVPIFHLVLHITTFPLEPAWMSAFTPQSNSPFETNFNNDTILNEKKLIEESNLFLHKMTMEYFPSSIVFAIQEICDAMVLVICLNLIEGFIYLHIFIYFRR